MIEAVLYFPQKNAYTGNDKGDQLILIMCL